MIRAEGVTVELGGTRVLDDVDVAVAEVEAGTADPWDAMIGTD